MAVYTAVSESDLKGLLANFHVGDLRSFEGISSGIENTNYFVSTLSGEYVLTIFERLGESDLPFYLNLMHHLAEHGIPCPNPETGRDGRYWTVFADKPAALVSRLSGQACTKPGLAECAAIGDMLANMHIAAQSFAGQQANLRGPAWWRQVVPELTPHLHPRERAMLDDEMATQTTFAASASARALPRAAVHADLFRDNALFSPADNAHGLVVSGVIDFYFAGIDTLLFDLAVTVNDWCIHDADGCFDEPRLSALLGAYTARRPIAKAEALAWPYALRAAALRFWLSRLHDAHAPREAHTLQPKDPREYERILAARRQDALASSALLPVS